MVNPDTSANIGGGTFVNLDPQFELKINGVDGVTGDGFAKGIKTSDADFDSHVVDLIELYL